MAYEVGDRCPCCREGTLEESDDLPEWLSWDDIDAFFRCTECGDGVWNEKEESE